MVAGGACSWLVWGGCWVFLGKATVGSSRGALVASVGVVVSIWTTWFWGVWLRTVAAWLVVAAQWGGAPFPGPVGNHDEILSGTEE